MRASRLQNSSTVPTSGIITSGYTRTPRFLQWTAASIQRTTGAPAMIAPNLGGSLPNEEFAVTLGMPTIWIPHSYTGCSQHAPNEHALKPLLREGLAVMAGVWWDLGEAPPAP